MKKQTAGRDRLGDLDYIGKPHRRGRNSLCKSGLFLFDRCPDEGAH